jgi:UrcA family protein
MTNLIAAAFGLAFFLNATAHAAEEEAPRREVVHYWDLDLRSADGVSALDRRVKRAIRKVCGSPGVRLWERSLERQCVRQASIEAEAQVQKAIRKARSGVPAPARPAG